MRQASVGSITQLVASCLAAVAALGGCSASEPDQRRPSQAAQTPQPTTAHPAVASDVTSAPAEPAVCRLATEAERQAGTRGQMLARAADTGDDSVLLLAGGLARDAAEGAVTLRGFCGASAGHTPDPTDGLNCDQGKLYSRESLTLPGRMDLALRNAVNVSYSERQTLMSLVEVVSGAVSSAAAGLITDDCIIPDSN